MKVLVGPNPMGLEQALPELREKYPQVTFAHCTTQAGLVAAIADADVYVGWLSPESFAAARQLKWVQSPSSGVNHFLDIPGFIASDVLLTSASGTHGACLAESALGMILAFTRGIRASILAQQRHAWQNGAIRPTMVELTGSTLGIVGFGAVGRALAKRAQAFDLRILATDACPVDKPEYVAELWAPDRLPDLLRSSDYVVVTVPYTPQTVGMIGARELSLMSPHAMLVGISRGGIIDQVALAEALQKGRLAAAALDVCTPEPLPPDDPLWDVDNLLLSAHIAGGTQFEGPYILEILRENLGRFFRGVRPLRNQVDKERWF
ncbi:MAG: D-2-hydroxyacid dehydrogenase [Anaerolineae bacterium]|nr:D-2-hydroxyacid dehydrogenase [Anaerolineae bacterium]